MSIVKDMSLAPSGRQKIRWVRDFMPALSGIEERFRREKPFAGLTIAVSVHLEAKTANLGLVLREGGADVHLTGCNPLSTQDDVAAAMADLGVDTYGVYGVDMAGYENLLVETLKCRPHLIVDDGGDLISLLGDRCNQYGERLIGGCEETTTGIHRLYARQRAGILPCPMMAVNDAKAKHYYDNKYGTGQSTMDAIMHTTNLMVAGKTVVVAGYGWCGKGIAMRAKGMGANVIVCEVDPFKALEATMENFRVMPMDQAARLGDLFITATGCKDIIVKRHFQVMKDNALLCNSGHFDCEVDVAALGEMAAERFDRRANIRGYRLPDGRTLNVLAEGRLVNLAAGNGHPAEIMDMSFAVQALSLEWLAKHRGELEKKVYNVPDEIDDQIGRVKLAAMGLAIDELTQEQRDYLAGWEA
ncbi:adenosylhomocysteinase [Lawsonibacter sp. OA9]|uniref:adenosylhomocysteinase n=1 Tax=Lawsonibacter sp. OA9 TaxID=2914163 RepID=UPI001F06A9E2|nr:adenosylhomocysteinase [Lawsonibacter sp. OA9]MCH1980362.1 adenosylhomocysteinase [Lawsonibacter sp. OA9]